MFSSIVYLSTKLDFRMTDEEVELLKSFSTKRMRAFDGILFDIGRQGRLDHATFSTVLHRVKRQRDRVLPEEVKLVKAGDMTHCTSNNKSVFFKKTSKNASGYASPDNPEPAFSLKFIFHEFIARREVKISHLLGRDSSFWFFINSSATIASAWVPGAMLEEFESGKGADKIGRHPFMGRVKCLHTLLTELNILHASLRSHNDLLTKNVVLDLAQSRLSLIDFDETCKIYNQTSYIKDMYKVGVIIQVLFPELKKLQPDNCLHQALFRLQHATTNDYTTKTICTSEQAMQFCAALLSNEQPLTLALLDKITSETIHRTEITMEDAIRGYRKV